MLRFTAFAVLLAVVCAVPINDDSKSGDRDDFFAQNPGVELIGEKRFYTKRYSFGKHVNGDRLVASRDNIHYFTRPSFVSATVHYPERSGEGSIVSRVEVLVNQTSAIGKAFIVSGGIGEREISVEAEAHETLDFHSSIQIYAYNAPT